MIRRPAALAAVFSLSLATVVTVPVLAGSLRSAAPSLGSRGFGAMKDLLRLADRLGLTAAQRDEIRGLFRSRRAELVGLVEREKEARFALQDRIRRGTLDVDGVRQASAAVARVDEDLALVRARLFADVSAVLTPAQRAELAAALTEQRRSLVDRIDLFVSLASSLL